MHGGAKGSGAPAGSRNGNYTHGLRTREMQALRAEVRAILTGSRAQLDRLGDL
jgi:riboflavin biosynthesis pyrimidine reductase